MQSLGEEILLAYATELTFTRIRAANNYTIQNSFFNSVFWRTFQLSEADGIVGVGEEMESLSPITRDCLNFFTLTLKPLGRNHIASAPTGALAKLFRRRCAPDR
jgi:hypothetical protein